MSVGTSVQGAAIGAVIGPDHSPLFPSSYYTAWLDGSNTVIAMTGLTVLASAFEVVADYSTNTATIDGGVCPASTPARFGLMDTAVGDTVLLWAPVAFADGGGSPITPTEDDPLTFAAGALKFQYAEV